MAKTKKTLHNELRARYMKEIKEFLESKGEEVLTTNSNEFAIPCVDSEGNDEFLVLGFKIPTGSRDGDAYDGYGEAESFQMKTTEKADKAKAAAEAKAKKIAKDKAQREAKAKAKAEHEAKGISAGDIMVEKLKKQIGITT
jgi:hypothetical protein